MRPPRPGCGAASGAQGLSALRLACAVVLARCRCCRVAADCCDVACYSVREYSSGACRSRPPRSPLEASSRVRDFLDDVLCSCRSRPLPVRCCDGPWDDGCRPERTVGRRRDVHRGCATVAWVRVTSPGVGEISRASSSARSLIASTNAVTNDTGAYLRASHIPAERSGCDRPGSEPLRPTDPPRVRPPLRSARRRHASVASRL